jgi:circadian clock protein KaiC
VVTDCEVTEKRERQTTGIGGLDKVLHGGLLSGSIYIIRGTPGAGKTITANQICCHWADQGKGCLYVTLLSESHDRLIENLEELEFYSKESTQRIHYMSGFHTLEEEGLTGILRMLMEETRRYDTCMMVLDGLFALQERVDSDRAFRLFMNQLQNLAHLTGNTVLMLTNSERGTGSPEYTMVDGWMEVAVKQHEYRTLRYLQVHKFRGSGFIDGQHALSISDAGVRVLPRLESAVWKKRQPPPSRGRLASGIAGLDKMMGGGLRRVSNTLVIGPTGIGKTATGLHFISECTTDEPGLIFGFYESQEDLIEKAQVLGIGDLEAAFDSGALEMVWHSPTEHNIDQLAYSLIDAVKRRGVKRLFLDGIDALRQSGLHPSRFGRYLNALTNILRNEELTTMFTVETPDLLGGEPATHFPTLSAVAQNILLLRYSEIDSQIFRSICIIKARSSWFDARVRNFSIGERGICIEGPFINTDDVLTGHGHPRPAKGNDADE